MYNFPMRHLTGPSLPEPKRPSAICPGLERRDDRTEGKTSYPNINNLQDVRQHDFLISKSTRLH
jgi:hypothetical protein